MICRGTSVADILIGCDLTSAGSPWAKRVTYMQPNHVLELGTGQGASGACIMLALPTSSKFTTINYSYPENYSFGELLDPWVGDKRLVRVSGDTTNPAILNLVDGGVDLMFMDTTHEAYVTCAELRLWQGKLEDGAIVVVDDLSHHDMCDFWASIQYEKVGASDQGVFRYDASKPYAANITNRATDDFTQRRLYIDRP